MKSSQAWDLAENGESEAAIRAALANPDVAAALPLALDSALRERAPADPVAIVQCVTQFTGLVGQNWSADGRKEFIGLAARELSTLPGQMVLAALTAARKEVNDGRNLVTFVFGRIEKKLERLDKEITRLELFSALASNA